MTLILLLFTAAVISAPAAAANLQGLSHAAAPVANGQHHHHDRDGSVSIHDADQEGAEQPGSGATDTLGHSHMASPMFDVAPVPSHLTRSLALRAPTPASANTPALGTLGWSPQIRPPRSA